MANQKETLTKKQTPREVESGFSDPSRQEREIKNINDAGREMQDLFLKGDAAVEIKKDVSGQKYAVVKHKDKIIYSTKVPEDIVNFEEFLKGPEAYLRKQQLRETEKDFSHKVEEEVLKPYK